jgi:hypothetical protein
VTDWSVVFLGVIAVATLVMALIQVGAIIYAGRLAARIEQLTRQVERDVRPMIDKLTAVSADAARASSLAVTQVERVDALMADLTVRVDQTMTIMQNAIVTPAREGLALVRGLRAGLAALRGLRDGGRRPGAHVEEEEGLFIG